MYDTIIVGGGASGLLASVLLDGKTLLIESADRVGKKILATGNGRCNLSNEYITGDEYSNPQFFRDVLQTYGGNFSDIWQELGLFTRKDQVGRIYPFSNQASTVLDVLRFSSKAEIKSSCTVKSIKKKKDGYVVVTDCGEFYSQKVLLTVGGGKLQIAKDLGLKVTDTYPALCGLKTDTDKIKGLDGVRAHAKVSLVQDGVEKYAESGEVLFRKYGISGIAVFNASAVYARSLKDKKSADTYLKLDLLDGLDRDTVIKELEKRIANKERDLLLGIIPLKIANSVLNKIENAETIVQELSKVQLKVHGLLGENAQITVGGVDLDEVKPTLESKKYDGLYICGEVLDQDGLCGGYNLHWAFLSAAVASRDINK